jgi:hypothetical protein
MKKIKQEAEVIMNLVAGSYDDVTIDDIIYDMIDALNYGVECEEDIEAFLDKTDYGRNLKRNDMENKVIPTAEELFKKYSWTAKLDGETLKVVDRQDFLKAIKLYAKLHVEQALKEVSEQADYHTDGQEHIEQVWIDKDSILNSYPLDKIK